ncbi:hypothetical protein [Streptomyces sp. NPDC002855]|uniref:hypothetical protein n=1 Tax=Streptomyces sp. NPDC002855 TaxID=3154437 RepID=UPI003330697E
MMKKFIGIAAAVIVAGTAGGVIITQVPYEANADQYPTYHQHPEPGDGDEPATGSYGVEPREEDPQPNREEPRPEPQLKPGVVKVDGTPVDNLRPDRADDGVTPSDYCAASNLPPSDAAKDKSGTCVSTSLGEIAKNPVRVAVTNAKPVYETNKPIKLDVLVADDKGPLDLNAFTKDKTGKAGDTLHEHPGELGKDGRPLAHGHIGVVKLDDKNALPGNKYDAAFSGLQSVKGEVSATISALPPGNYRADFFFSVPGHTILPTGEANDVQAFDAIRFEVK